MMLEKWEHVASDKSLVALVDSGQESDVMLTVQSVTVSGRPNPTPHPPPRLSNPRLLQRDCVVETEGGI